MALMTMSEIAQELNNSPHTIRSWVRAGFIPHLRVGRQIRFDLDEVRAWLKRRSCQGQDTLATAPKVTKYAEA